MILILTDPNSDTHSSIVQTELTRRKEESVVFNPGLFPRSSTITVEIKNKKLVPTIIHNDKKIDLTKIKSIWIRRPTKFDLGSILKPEESSWIQNECNQLIRAIWANTNALWVSKPANIRMASLKISQLKMAVELGFRIPKFVITNNVERATKFVESTSKGTIVKVLGEPAIYNKKRVATIYTHLITKKDRKFLGSVQYGPTFLQEFIKKKMDVRVTVIGKKIFAAGIDSANYEKARIDFRRAEIFDLPHRTIDLPKNIKTACIEMVQRFGLQFGAIDLLLTPDGKYVFLEINPNGQWLWIEWTTGLPLTDAICDLLTGKARHNQV